MPTASQLGKAVLTLTPMVAPLVAGGSLRWLLDAAI